MKAVDELRGGIGVVRACSMLGVTRSPTNYVAGALAAKAAGRAADPATTKPYGCSIKFAG